MQGWPSWARRGTGPPAERERGGGGPGLPGRRQCGQRTECVGYWPALLLTAGRGVERVWSEQGFMLSKEKTLGTRIYCQARCVGASVKRRAGPTAAAGQPGSVGAGGGGRGGGDGGGAGSGVPASSLPASHHLARLCRIQAPSVPSRRPLHGAACPASVAGPYEVTLPQGSEPTCRAMRPSSPPRAPRQHADPAAGASWPRTALSPPAPLPLLPVKKLGRSANAWGGPHVPQIWRRRTGKSQMYTLVGGEGLGRL